MPSDINQGRQSRLDTPENDTNDSAQPAGAPGTTCGAAYNPRRPGGHCRLGHQMLAVALAAVIYKQHSGNLVPQHVLHEFYKLPLTDLFRANRSTIAGWLLFPFQLYCQSASGLLQSAVERFVRCACLENFSAFRCSQWQSARVCASAQL